MIEIFLKTLLTLFSFAGISTFLAKKLDIKFEYTMIISISFIAISVFVFGLFNILLLGSLGLYISGFVLMIYYLYKKNFKKIHPFFWFLLCILLVLFFILVNSHLMHYDNFSHWAVIVKDMLRLNAFPTEINGSIVTFVTYPPGSSCFIYYIARFIGSGDGTVLFAQSLILVASIIPVLGVVKKNKAAYAVFFILFLVILTINISIHDLLVDTILATVGTSIILIIYDYKDNSKKSLILTVPIMIFLMLIKNSGIFFVILSMFFNFYYAVRSRTNISKSDWLFIFLCFTLPFVFSYLWGRHVNYVFNPEIVSGAKHSMSFSSYIYNLNLLDFNNILNICRNFIFKLVDFHSPIIILLYVVEICFSFLVIILPKKLKKYFLILNIILIVYLISLLGMYLFSMPYPEAITLASFDRYLATILIFIIMTIYVISFQNDTHLKEMICVCVILFSSLFLVCDIESLFISKYNGFSYETSGNNIIREKIENATDINKENLVLLKISNPSYSEDYNWYYVRYLLESNNFEIIESVDELGEYDNYIFIE